MLLRACLVAAIVWTAPGCTVCKNGMRTVVCEPIKYCANIDLVRSKRAYKSWAHQAWAREGLQCGSVVSQADYARGFEDGFVDYLMLGGTGEPPPVPPRRYWKIRSRSGPGKEQAAQWFEGYRHGARVAMDGVYRDRATIESSLFGFASAEPLPMHEYHSAEPILGPELAPPLEDLPLPARPVTPPPMTLPPSLNTSQTDADQTSPATTADLPATERRENVVKASHEPAAVITQPKSSVESAAARSGGSAVRIVEKQATTTVPPARSTAAANDGSSHSSRRRPPQAKSAAIQKRSSYALEHVTR